MTAYGLLAFTLSAYAGEPTPPAPSSTPPALQSQDAHSYHAASQLDGPPLSIQEAMQLALTDQPILLNREALATAEEQQAISAAQLPDPKLSVELKELPV